MKHSKFNHFVELNSKIFVYNSFSSALTEIDDRIYSALNSIDGFKTISESELKELVDNSMIVDDDVDEVELVQERVIDTRLKAREDELCITIIPTLKCNLQCTYCYQDRTNDQTKSVMTQSVEERIINLVKSSKASKVSVLWFGGEPTLCLSTVRRVTERIRDFCIEANRNTIFL